MGSILALASQAAAPSLSGGATCVDLPSTSFASAMDSAGVAGESAASAGASSADYAMELLARITHSGADQALTLIQGVSVGR